MRKKSMKPTPHSLILYLYIPLLFVALTSALLCGAKTETETTDSASAVNKDSQQELASSPDNANTPQATQTNTLRFSQVQPIFEQNSCTGCHRWANDYSGVKEHIVPGNPNESKLFQLIRDDKMPPSGNPVSDEDKQTIQTWIQNGAME